jgi:hypothetical protein
MPIRFEDRLPGDVDASAETERRGAMRWLTGGVLIRGPNHASGD